MPAIAGCLVLHNIAKKLNPVGEKMRIVREMEWHLPCHVFTKLRLGDLRRQMKERLARVVMG